MQIYIFYILDLSSTKTEWMAAIPHVLDNVLQFYTNDMKVAKFLIKHVLIDTPDQDLSEFRDNYYRDSIARLRAASSGRHR